ncbi:MAG: GNAT family N-acetyltransferase [Paenibacillus sp.]|uniref:GNAT family N-acetyltransferase n=1 Tax=Paenibacillus sp. TaxID=58172 RepID=UPI00290CCB3E|nr:GNAT family N-acetyltransferase [Paenibacillus sp.]MDU4696895.1 GNAT family N-acetyltransferase [Paenibacillus sp.]
MKQLTDTLETEQGTFTVSLAGENDLDEVRQLLIEAASWMQENGVKQWNPQQFTPELIRAYYEEREIYLLHTSGKTAAMFTLQDTDPDYWGERNIAGYSYLHRLTIRLPYRGRGLSAEILRYAARQSRALQRTGLRLDCWNQNLKLNRLYQSLGFQLQGTGRLNGREFNLYQLDPQLYYQS